MNDTAVTLRNQQDAALRFLKFSMTHDKTPEGAAKAIEIAVNEIEAAREQIMHLQMALAQAESHVAQMKDVLDAYERWEADLIQYCDAWVDRLPTITQEFYDRVVEIGGMRNAAVRALGSASI